MTVQSQERRVWADRGPRQLGQDLRLLCLLVVEKIPDARAAPLLRAPAAQARCPVGLKVAWVLFVRSLVPRLHRPFRKWGGGEDHVIT